MLRARTSPSRLVFALDGVWDFQIDSSNDGVANRWFAGPLSAPRPMPVPASYNDITTDKAVHDHVGYAWYQRTDFQTTPGIMRVVGNKKGMFTRDRLPKSAAYDVRDRWLRLKDEQGN
ncbi:MAG TPA: hypothetical protein K8V15_11055 [Tessaracoccus flavescens]|uniref:Glycoside hydrolase family 2 catalytic domain-containing protein n=1 Tax=Tessaracoccus flavescens TaxID=399497 RepID=A0A921JRV2_9ACTN|nr:hypothetical protein [Tessaracoccus flavescens]